MEPEPKRMNALFDEAKPALLAMESDALLRPRVGRERASQLTAQLIAAFAPLLPTLSTELSSARATQRKADFEALEGYALIYYAAELSVETPWTSERKARRAELTEKVRNHDDTLSAWAVPAFKFDPQASEVVADILRGKGIRDDADDTIRLISLYRAHWDALDGKLPITAAQLDEAEAEATELLGILDGTDNDDGKGSPKDLRRRAYTQWHNAYQEILHLGRYLTRHDPEANAQFLAISNERTETNSSPESPQAPEATAPEE